MKKRTIKIVAPDNTKIEIDAFMKPALIHLWGRGIQTRFSCAGHFPDFKAHIQIERNADFENYTMKSPWKHEVHPIKEIDPGKYGEVPPVDRRETWVFLPADIVIDTGRTSFTVYACENQKGYSRKIRGRFLRWLLEY